MMLHLFKLNEQYKQVRRPPAPRRRGSRALLTRCAQVLEFLSNDFNQDRWKKAAVKNAFAALKAQKYEVAVAFFILGERTRRCRRLAQRAQGCCALQATAARTP
jgi:hypothetical protein